MANTVEIIIKGTDQASGAFNSASSGAQTLSGTLTNAGTAMMATGAKMTAGISVPLGMISVKAVTAAADFEESMNILAVAARSSGTGLEDLSAAAIKVGADTDLVGVSAADAAEAMTNFYKAGLDTTDIFGDLNAYLGDATPLIGAMRASVDLAAASDLDLAEASDAVTIAMAQFGLSAEEATGIADSFVQAADASVADVSDLTAALENVGPVMGAFGYSLEDTNTALAIMSMAGQKGVDAGTNLKTMMLNLTSGIDEVDEALADLNVELYDHEGVLKPLPEIIADLETAMAGMTQEQRNVAMASITTRAGILPLTALLQEGAEGWSAMEAAIAEAATAQEVAEANQDALNRALENLGGVIETLMIEAFIPFIEEALTPFIQQVTEIVSSVTEADPELFRLGTTIGAIAIAAGPVLVALGAMVTLLGALLTPIGLVVAAVAGLAVAWATDFGGIRTTTTEFWNETIQPALSELTTWLQTNIPVALAFLQETWQTVWPSIQAVFEAVWGVVQAALQVFMDEVLPFLLEELGIVVDWMTENWPLIQETVETVMGAINDVVTAVVGAVVEFWTTNHDTIMSVASTIWENIQTTIDTTINAVLGILKTIMLLINADWDAAWTEIQGVAETVWEAIKTLVENDIELIKSTIELALSALQIVWDTIWDAIDTKVLDVWESIKTTITDTSDDINTVIDDVLASIEETWNTIWDAVDAKVTEIWDTIETTIDDAIGSIDTAIRDTFEGIRTFLGDLLDGPAGIVQMFTDAFAGLVTKAGEFGSSILTAMKDAMLAVKIPMPTFSVSWEPGPLGISVPKLTLGVDWQSLGDLLGFSGTSAVALNSPAAMEPGGASAGGVAASQSLDLGPPLEERMVQLLEQMRDIMAESRGRTGEFAGSDLLYQLAGATL